MIGSLLIASARVGAALSVVVNDATARLAEGARPRADGFSDADDTGRAPADERLEGTLLQAANTYEGRNIPFVGLLYSSLAFDSSISAAHANYLLKLADRLTYGQLVWLKLLGEDRWGDQLMQLDAERVFDWALEPNRQPEESPFADQTGMDRSNGCYQGTPSKEDPDKGKAEPDPPEKLVETFSNVRAPLDSQQATSTVPLYHGNKGWGRRHIVIEHGWNSSDSTSTSDALESPSAIILDRYRESYRYYRYWTTDANIDCTRRVVVNFDPNSKFPKTGPTKPRGIITSFAYPTNDGDPEAGTGL